MKKSSRKIRHLRIRKRITSLNKGPRLVVFRSNKHIYAQIIDDLSSKTQVSSSDLLPKNQKTKSQKVSKIDQAHKVGLNLALQALKKNIRRVIFDRAGYKYHGRVKALAEGAREGGLDF